MMLRIKPLCAESLFVRKEILRLAKTFTNIADEENSYIIDYNNLIVGVLQIENERVPDRQLAPMVWTVRNLFIFDKYRKQGMGTATFEELLNTLHGVVVWDIPEQDTITYRFIVKLKARLGLDTLPSENNEGSRRQIRIVNQGKSIIEKDAMFSDAVDVLLTVEDAAGLMSISKSLLYRLIADGEIPTAEGYSKCCIKKKQLETWIDYRVNREGGVA